MTTPYHLGDTFYVRPNAVTLSPVSRWSAVSAPLPSAARDLASATLPQPGRPPDWPRAESPALTSRTVSRVWWKVASFVASALVGFVLAMLAR
ncbi:hypothetical protein GCM10023317_21910 [Actinopolymorpha pittospori]